MLVSNTFTLAPRPSAARVANSPTVPAPITTTSVGATPEMPPSIRPGPPFSELSCSEAIRMAVFPAISPMARMIG